MTNRNRQASLTMPIPAGFEPATHGPISACKPSPFRTVFRKLTTKPQAVDRFGPPILHGCAVAGRRLGPRTWLSTNVACDYFAGRFRRHESVTF
jgi:hypothetical protein